MNSRLSTFSVFVTSLILLTFGMKAYARNFSFQRTDTELVNVRTITDVLLNSGEGDGDEDDVDNILLAFASSLTSVSQIEPRNHSGTAEAVGEAFISIAPTLSGFAPNLDITATVFGTATNESGPPARARGTAIVSSKGSFIVTDENTDTGIFEGGIHLLAAGIQTEFDDPILIDLSSSIKINGDLFSITAIKNSSGPFELTVLTPVSELTFTGEGIDEFLFVSWPVAPGDIVEFETSFSGFAESETTTFSQSDWSVSATAFGYAARQLGDFNGNGDVDGRDFLTWQREVGVAVEAGNGADGNGDGMVDTLDLEIWQRHFGESINELSAIASVPEPHSLVLVVGVVFCCIRRRKQLLI